MADRVSAAAANTDTDTNAAAVVTLAAPTRGRKAVAYVVWSYSAAPTGGRLTMASGADTFFDIDITAAGPGALKPVPLPGEDATSIVVTLAAGGGGVVGKLNAYAVTVT
jgi:hypothetical protein